METRENEDLVLTEEEIRQINEKADFYLEHIQSDKDSNGGNSFLEDNCSQWSAEIFGDQLKFVNKESVWTKCLFVCKIKKQVNEWLEDGIQKQSVKFVINVDMIPEPYLDDYFNDSRKTVMYRSKIMSHIFPHYSSGDVQHFSYQSLNGAKRGVKRLINNSTHKPTMRIKWIQENKTQ